MIRLLALLILLTPALAFGGEWLATRSEIVAEVQRCARVYGVDWRFAWAVARTESGTKHQEYRLGRLGRTPYAGPFGLHIAYVREKFGVDATDPRVNIEVGVRALRGRDKIHVLRRYNKASNRNYERAVLARMKEEP